MNTYWKVLGEAVDDLDVLTKLAELHKALGETRAANHFLEQTAESAGEVSSIAKALLVDTPGPVKATSVPVIVPTMAIAAVAVAGTVYLLCRNRKRAK